jgi:hypothetical protein
MGTHRFTGAFVTRRPATLRARTNTVKRIQKRADQLLRELKAIDSRTLAGVMVEAEGGWSNVSRDDLQHRVARLNEEREFLRRLAATTPPAYWKRERGKPFNVIAHLVLRDAAAIYEWFTGTKAARGVHPIRRTASGPFFRFAAVLWPVIFPKKAPSLPTALKNWAHARSRYREQSPLLINMNLRHLTWRIFERKK